MIFNPIDDSTMYNKKPLSTPASLIAQASKIVLCALALVAACGKPLNLKSNPTKLCSLSAINVVEPVFQTSISDRSKADVNRFEWVWRQTTGRCFRRRVRYSYYSMVDPVERWPKRGHLAQRLQYQPDCCGYYEIRPCCCFVTPTTAKLNGKTRSVVPY